MTVLGQYKKHVHKLSQNPTILSKHEAGLPKHVICVIVSMIKKHELIIHIYRLYPKFIFPVILRLP